VCWEGRENVGGGESCFLLKAMMMLVRALCFAALIDGFDMPRLRRAAEMCFALAQAWMYAETVGLESFTFASRAAAQRECDGVYFLGRCYEADGCERDLEKAKENYLVSSKIHVAAIYDVGKLLD